VHEVRTRTTQTQLELRKNCKPGFVGHWFATPTGDYLGAAKCRRAVLKLDIRRLFLRSSRLGLPLGGNLDDAADTNFHQGSGSDGEGLEAEYRELISGHFVRWGIRTESVTIEVEVVKELCSGKRK
jgi:hypothetical protein